MLDHDAYEALSTRFDRGADRCFSDTGTVSSWGSLSLGVSATEACLTPPPDRLILWRRTLIL